MTELYDALDNCLEALERGASLERALKRYPNLASELRPLLQAAVLARSSARVHVPLDVRRRGRSRILQHSAVLAEKRGVARRRVIPLFPRMAVTILLAAVLVLTSTGLVSASSGALPGQQLYPVKRTWETVRLWLAVSPADRELLESGFEQERLDEIDELIGLREAAPITFSGVLTRRSDGTWLISGIPVSVTGSTALPSNPLLDGAPVTVTGSTAPNGVVEAQAIHLLQPGSSLPPLEPSEQIEHMQQGDTSEDTIGPKLPTGLFTPAPANAAATPAPSTSATPTPRGSTSGSVPNQTTYQFSGVIQSMHGNVWMINGQSVQVDAADITGQLSVGSIVKFQGYYDAAGNFIVTVLQPQGGSGNSKSGGASGGSDGSSGGSGGDDSGGGDH